MEKELLKARMKFEMVEEEVGEEEELLILLIVRVVDEYSQEAR